MRGGAFSGANSSGKQGLFEMANGGTLLLDEIGDMPMDLQVKLLRAIQNKEITRVGGTKPIKLDIRIIAATNSDLKRKISEGTFRQDLYYRLNVIPIYIPPLRERLNDLDDLCDHFVAFFTEKHGRAFTPDRRSESHHEAVHLAGQHPRAGKRHRIPDHLRLRDQKRWLMKCSAACWTSPRATETITVTSGGTLSQSIENYEKSLIESVLRGIHQPAGRGRQAGRQRLHHLPQDQTVRHRLSGSEVGTWGTMGK